MSIIEVFGNITGKSIAPIYVEEGSQYEYYANNNANWMKYNDGSACYWWLRSPAWSYSYGWTLVEPSGQRNAFSELNATNSLAISFAFCF